MSTRPPFEADASSPRFIRCADDRDLAVQAADIVQETLTPLPHPVVLLATGKTPHGLYAELAARRDTLSLTPSTRVFALDEYLGIPADHPQSFRQELLESVIQPLGLPPACLETPRGDDPDPDAEAQRYERLLVAAGDADLAVVGVGRNGHIAFNEPGTPVTSLTHVAHLSQDTREANTASSTAGEWPPPQAITVGIATILRSRRILVLARGAEKADAVAALSRPSVDPHWPVSALRDHPDVVVCVDEAAASTLGRLDALGHPVHPGDHV